MNTIAQRAIPESSSNEKTSCKPFLKWAGGKTQLLPHILKRVPQNFHTYHEPFIGSGAVYFALQPERAILADYNSELISCYTAVRDNVGDVIGWLKRYRYDENEFYRVRGLDRLPEFDLLPNYARAARLIYLNKTCFNGLYRVSKQGFFNTPFGKYKNPKIFDAEHLRRCSNLLQDTKLCADSFESVVDRAEAGDFIYLDPPYPPLSETADFTSYTDAAFDWQKQLKLKEVCDALDKKGANFLLSNAAVTRIEELYSNYRQERVAAKRAINSKAELRGAVDEFLISNF